MKFTIDNMLEHYAKEAHKHGLAATSTIQDERTRQLEYFAIEKYIQADQKVLEPGCGNGYTAWQLAKNKKISIDAYDLCPELILLAKERSSEGLLGKINYFEASAVTWSNVNKYDVVFTERSLQNIPTWENQCCALDNIYASLKVDGIYVMEECFTSGLNNLNLAREELNLSKIEQPWHNVFFDDDQLFTYMSQLGFNKINEDPFLSGYYFGSRILLPAISPNNKQVKSSSILNDYFCALPPAGNFSPMRIVVFKKTK